MQTPCRRDGVEDGVLISEVVIRTTAAEESQHEVGSTLKSERICRIHHQNHVKNQKCGVFILLKKKEVHSHHVFDFISFEAI